MYYSYEGSVAQVARYVIKHASSSSNGSSLSSSSDSKGSSKSPKSSEAKDKKEDAAVHRSQLLRLHWRHQVARHQLKQ